MLNIETRHIQPDITILDVAGRIILGRESAHIEKLVGEAIERDSRHVLFNLAETNQIDSTGIGTITSCYSKVSRAGGEVSIAGAKGMVLDTLKITRLDHVIPLFDDVPAALKQFREVEPAA